MLSSLAYHVGKRQQNDSEYNPDGLAARSIGVEPLWHAAKNKPKIAPLTRAEGDRLQQVVGRQARFTRRRCVESGLMQRLEEAKLLEHAEVIHAA
jgi:hypothetical protein